MISTMATSGWQQQAGGFDPVDSRLAARVLLFGGCALLGAAIWVGWLGWDSPAGDAVEYSTAQLMGCAVSIGVFTALVSRWRNPLVVAGGTTLGVWVPSTVHLAGDPVAGGALWAVAAVMLLFALVAITGVAAAVGHAWRRWRAPAATGPAPGRPGDLWRTGVALVVVGGGWLLVGAVARQVYPLVWSYSAIVHVPLDLLAAVAVAAGVVMAVDSAHRRRTLRLQLRPLAPSAALGAVLVVAVLVGRSIPAGNGFNGQVGVMAGPGGAPVAVLGVCEGTVDSLEVLDLVYEQSLQQGDAYAPAARLHHDGGLDGVVVVDLTRPPPQWAGTPLGAAASGEDELNISATGRQSLLDDTYFTRAEVEQLSPGMVLYSVWEQPDGAYQGNEQAPLADFAAVACSGRGRNA